jgi:hypothetical protein
VAARQAAAAARRKRLAAGRVAFYSPAIDTPTAPEEPAMTTRLQARLMSFAFAAIATLGILAGVDGLATSDTTPAQMAASASAPRG